jgi:hypothetical protein
MSDEPREADEAREGAVIPLSAGDLDETENIRDKAGDWDETEQAPLGGTHDIAEAMEACVRARGFAQTIRNLAAADRIEAAANVAGVLQQLDKAITCLGMLGGNP